MILVYEYLPGESLTDHLYKRARKGKPSLPALSWVQRLKIVTGAARGLDYLHTGTGIENRVIHRDIKTSNILLDQNLAAKISDFGLSKIGPANQTCTYVSTRVKGTTGYIDPYYFTTHRLTRKTDVYAFGVVLFEVLSGRPVVDTSLNEEQINLAEWAQHCHKVGHLDKITDPSIKGDISSDSLNAYVDVAIKCLHSQPKHRPTMAEIVVGLESALTLQEKSTHYSLVEILPSDSTIEDEDCSIPEVKSTKHKLEQSKEMMINSSNEWHRKKQSSARMKIIRRVSGLLSFTARIFSVNGDAKTSGYRNRNSFLSLHHWVRRTPSNQEEVLQSSKLKRFSINDLNKATNNFDSVLGEGGFGRVYKGWVKENTFAAAKWGTGLGIAVKTLHGNSKQGYREWLAEIRFLGELSHPNLLKLIGYCLEGREKLLLIFEFMPHGSLDKHLFRNKTGGSHFKPLSWKHRTSIALGAAKGLAYLHSAEANVIYRDLKTANILIDSGYIAKLSDFGFAKFGPDDDHTHVSTRLAGTIGYLAPEYALRGYLTKKSDIYCFGVVLLEILTGRSVNEINLLDTGHDLISWAMPYLTSENGILYVMDADIKGQYTVRAAVGAFSLALKCISEDSKSRPDANQVVQELEQLQDLENSEIIRSEILQ
ncbi:receptor-like cytoplasmic kinase 176 [Apium graveolens]|uniref:receptor-like cytoplasmic kinase 176 n=1 Tax=Apium graveolens TaxID=4045 RepID=UPI003D7BF647